MSKPEYTREDIDALTEIIKRGDLDGMMSAAAMAQIIADRWRPSSLQEQAERVEFEPPLEGDYLLDVDRGRDIILGNFNPSPSGGSWRLNPSLAIRDLIEAGWQPPSKAVIDDGAIKLLRSENERQKGQIAYLKRRNKQKLDGWVIERKQINRLQERNHALSRELVAKDDYILECEQRIVAKNAQIEKWQNKAKRRKAHTGALEHYQQELLRDYGRVTGRMDALIGKIKGLAEQWRYKGEFGHGAWQEGYGPDEAGLVLDEASAKLRVVLDDSEHRDDQ